MAIKGKSRRRSRGRTTQGTPPVRPQVAVGSWSSSPAARRAMVAIVTLGVVLSVARIAVNVNRSGDLRSYLRKLDVAQAPFIEHVDPGSETAFGKNSRAFQKGNMSVVAFKGLSEAWETDFRAVAEAVAALRPPRQLIAAQRTLLEGLDLYVGVARLYNLAAQQREIADKQTAAGQRAFEDKVQVTLVQTDEGLERARKVYSLGSAIIEDFKRAWLGIPEVPEVVGVPKGVRLPSRAPAAPPGG